MKKSKLSIDKLTILFKSHKILTLPEIKQAANTNSTTSVHRLLSTINYQTSYSHSGKYYTLADIPDYDHTGLWEFNNIFFSMYGKLAPTIEHIVNFSATGYFANELETLLKVFVHNELKKLYNLQKLRREQIGRQFLYLSNSIGDVQFKKRTEQIQHDVSTSRAESSATDKFCNIEHLKIFLSVLNEKQRRLFLGFESIRLGYGGDKIISDLTGIDARTIAKGRRELLSHDISIDRIRESGGGRPPIKKN